MTFVVGISVPIRKRIGSTGSAAWSVRGMAPDTSVAPGMAQGPEGFFGNILGSDAGYRLLTRVLPLGRGVVVEREDNVFVR